MLNTQLYTQLKNIQLKKVQLDKVKFPHLDKFQIFMTLVIIFSLLFSINLLVNQDDNEQLKTEDFVAKPAINDLYFLDFRLMSDNLRPREKYRLAKVIDITGDIVTLVYSDFYYFRQRNITESIRFGHLRFTDYYQGKRHDFTIENIHNMRESGAIYMVKRPINNELYGNFVTPSGSYYNTSDEDSAIFIPGKNEYIAGVAFLKSNDITHIETEFESAFEYFQKSAEYGYPKGQVNFAEMYLNNQYVEKDLNKALYWLKLASLQSHKPAIDKYTIVCKQQANCDLYNFYKELVASGVNLKVRNLDFKLTKANLLN